MASRTNAIRLVNALQRQKSQQQNLLAALRFQQRNLISTNVLTGKAPTSQALTLSISGSSHDGSRATTAVVMATTLLLCGGSQLLFSNSGKEESGAACAAATPAAVNPLIGAAASEAERLYNDANATKSSILDFLRRAEKVEPKNVEVKWRLARALYDVEQEQATPKDEKKRLIYEAFATIKEAMEVTENHFAVHKWYGIILSEIGSFESTKSSISNAYFIKDHFQKAILLNPNDATSRHLLGLWCWNIANISWVQRQVATAIFGTPPTSTFQEALDHFLAAESLDPGFYKKNTLMIAQCYLKLDNKRDGQIWLSKALAVPIKTEEDRQVHSEAEALLKQYK